MLHFDKIHDERTLYGVRRTDRGGRLLGRIAKENVDGAEAIVFVSYGSSNAFTSAETEQITQIIKQEEARS